MDFRVFSVLRFTDGMQLSELQDASASEALEPNMKREPWRATIFGRIRGGHFLIFFQVVSTGLKLLGTFGPTRKTS